VSPTVIAPVDTHNEHPETTTALDTSNNNIGDKSAFSYHLALKDVTDEIFCTNDIPKVVEPVLQLQHEIVSL